MLTLFTVQVLNRPNVLADLTRILDAEKINLTGIISDVGDGDVGYIRFTADAETPKVLNVLTKNNFTAWTTPVIGVEVDNTPGQLLNLSEKFGAANINIRSIFATVGGVKARIFFQVSDPMRAIELLGLELPAPVTAPASSCC